MLPGFMSCLLFVEPQLGKQTAQDALAGASSSLQFHVPHILGQEPTKARNSEIPRDPQISMEKPQKERINVCQGLGAGVGTREEDPVSALPTSPGYPLKPLVYQLTWVPVVHRGGIPVPGTALVKRVVMPEGDSDGMRSSERAGLGKAISKGPS